MKHTGVEDVMAEHLLTPVVLAHLAAAGAADLDGSRMSWHSWPQSFPTTAGPWKGIAGQAFTTFQVTVAIVGMTGSSDALILVFVGSDLYAYGNSGKPELWEQVATSSINTRQLAELGLHVLERRLR